jgi:hypothetical protein
LCLGLGFENGLGFASVVAAPNDSCAEPPLVDNDELVEEAAATAAANGFIFEYAPNPPENVDADELVVASAGLLLNAGAAAAAAKGLTLA